MQPWLETLGVIVLALLGFVVGLRLSRLQKPYWLAGYAVPLFFLFLVALVRNITTLRFVQPLGWVAAGRNESVIIAAALPMIFGTLIPNLANKRLRILLGIFLAATSVHFIIFPFLVPALVRGKLEKLQTFINVQGICIQSTDYTCGPAAAVTALQQFGISANEGRLAVMACTRPIQGTPDDLLAAAIEKLYGPQGVTCRYQRFDSLAELKHACPTIAVVKFAPFIDHYVTVLEVSNDYVIVGDPLTGKQKLTYKQFKDKWRFIGIVVEQNSKEMSGSRRP